MMSDGVLALGTFRGVTVNACGRLVEISPENSTSVSLLRRELGAQLNVANPTSLQLLNINGVPVQTDQDLFVSLQERSLPLQAKLTTAALHEIEQKKLEGKSKEQNLTSLQWQILIEQVSNFAEELTAVAGKVQQCEDDCAKKVRSFEDQEELRRVALRNLVKDEADERTKAHQFLIERIDNLTQMLHAEQQAREVADYQLKQQIEHIHEETNQARNQQAQVQAELLRSQAALKQELDSQLQNNSDNFVRNADVLQRVDHRVEELSQQENALGQRLTLLEADSEKQRMDVSKVATAVSKSQSETAQHLARHGDELEKFKSDHLKSKDAEATRMSSEHQNAMTNLGAKVQRVRDEFSNSHLELGDRQKLLELRTQALEKDHVDKNELNEIAGREFRAKMEQADTMLTAFKIDQQATDAVINKMMQQLEDVTERLQTAEVAVDHRVTSDHWRAQLDSVTSITRKQDAKIAQLERDMRAQFAQESQYRDEARAQLHYSLKNCVDKMNPVKDKAEDESVKGLPLTSETDRSTTPIRVRTSTYPASQIESRIETRQALPMVPANNAYATPTSATSPIPGTSVEVVTPTVATTWPGPVAKVIAAQRHHPHQCPPRSISPQPRSDVIYLDRSGMYSPTVSGGRSSITR